MEKYYTVDEVAAMTGLTSRTIRTYISQGRLTGMRLGKQWRFTEEDISRLYTSAPKRKYHRNDEKKPAVNQAVNDFLSQTRSYCAVCVIADCANMTEEEITKFEDRMSGKCAVSPQTCHIMREGSTIVFRSPMSEAADLLCTAADE